VIKGSKQVVVKRFNELNLHDDNLVSLQVYPSRTKKNSTRIDFELEDYSTKKRKLLSFVGCANIRYLMDFDVLAANYFAQIDGTISHSEPQKIEKLIQTQRAHWHVEYIPSERKDEPIRKKLSSLGQYALFRIAFFGGTIEILAKNFSLSE
jgi:hypothetical protein